MNVRNRMVVLLLAFTLGALAWANAASAQPTDVRITQQPVAGSAFEVELHWTFCTGIYVGPFHDVVVAGDQVTAVIDLDPPNSAPCPGGDGWQGFSMGPLSPGSYDLSIYVHDLDNPSSPLAGPLTVSFSVAAAPALGGRTVVVPTLTWLGIGIFVVLIVFTIAIRTRS